ncbi:MAG TPA: ECF-type sigma factor [Bryobacteraceae bacterium]|nr:ECF-type sigma factor [Bryobacteraceae bacterium]
MAPVERTDDESGRAEPGDITVLLRQWKEGVPGAEEKLYVLVFPHLRKLARNWLKKERPGHPMDSVGLVAEAYLRLLPAKDRVEWRNRDHFYAISARVMRRHLIDIGRKRARGSEVGLAGEDLPARWRDLDKAIDIARRLGDLEKADPELCAVAELKIFLELTDEETAEVMNLKLHTMQRRWHEARKWLFVRMRQQC